MLDNAALISFFCFATLLAAYLVYGRFLARRVFRLDPNRATPAHTLEDGVDFVPTKIPVLFGHHFASIAGLGPILGPAIAVTWGWLPAVIWVIVGSILIGAVHDLGALTVSLRFKGRSIGDVCRELIGGRARFLFLLIIFFLMSLAMGAFVGAISSFFVNFRPDAVVPSFGLMLVAVCMGIAVYRLKVGLGPATVVALAAFAGLIVWGVSHPLPTYEWFLGEDTRAVLDAGMSATPAADQPTWDAPYGAVAAQEFLTSLGNTEGAAEVATAVEETRLRWIWLLLAYGFIASVLPVWLLLQPRDYINSFQLYAALGLMFLGLVIAAFTGAQENVIDAAPLREVADAPPMFPFLMVTIACGAVSGFHSLVSSGTTVRQLNRETDALPIGFGGMLTEGALAVLVIMACVAGLGAAAWTDGGVYGSWSGIKGNLGAQLAAVVAGGASFLAQVGVPLRFAEAFLAVTIVAFAMTTLDSATRLLRFNVEEIFRSMSMPILANRYIASLVAVLGIAVFALVPAGKTLWTLFGTTNQLLAGLTLLTVSVFLFKLHRPLRFTLLTLVPMAIMLGVSIWAMLWSLSSFLQADEVNYVLVTVSIIVLFMATWLIFEGVMAFARGPGGLDLDDEPPPEPLEEDERAVASSHLG